MASSTSTIHPLSVPLTSPCFRDGDRQERPIPTPTLPAPDLWVGAPLSASQGSLPRSQERVGVQFIRDRIGWLSAPALAPLGTVGTVEAKLRLGQEMSH